MGRLGADLVLGNALATDFGEQGLTAAMFAPERFE
jgi:hypothetical protein